MIDFSSILLNYFHFVDDLSNDTINCVFIAHYEIPSIHWNTPLIRILCAFTNSPNRIMDRTIWAVLIKDVCFIFFWSTIFFYHNPTNIQYGMWRKKKQHSLLWHTAYEHAYIQTNDGDDDEEEEILIVAHGIADNSQNTQIHIQINVHRERYFV